MNSSTASDLNKEGELKVRALSEWPEQSNVDAKIKQQKNGCTVRNHPTKAESRNTSRVNPVMGSTAEPHRIMKKSHLAAARCSSHCDFLPKVRTSNRTPKLSSRRGHAEGNDLIELSVTPTTSLTDRSQAKLRVSIRI